MKILGVVLLAVALSGDLGAADDKGVQIQVVDGRVSMQATSVPLGRLLHLFDQATGMTSKVAPELTNRTVSVQFTDLPFDAAVEKIFEGQRLDYIVVADQRIIVTSASVTLNASSSPFSSPPQPVVQERTFVEENPPFMPPQQNAVPGQPPAMIQTPFGPIPNPRAQQGQQNNTAPLNGPGQQNSPQNNSLFGNTSPPAFNPNPQQPANPAMPTTPFGTPTIPGVTPGMPGGIPGNPAQPASPFPQPQRQP